MSASCVWSGVPLNSTSPAAPPTRVIAPTREGAAGLPTERMSDEIDSTSSVVPFAAPLRNETVYGEVVHPRVEAGALAVLRVHV